MIALFYLVQLCSVVYDFLAEIFEFWRESANELTTFDDFEQLPFLPLECVFQHSNVRELLLLAFQSADIEKAIQRSDLGTFRYGFRAEMPQVIETRLLPKNPYGKLEPGVEAFVMLKRIKGEDIWLWNKMKAVSNSEGLEIYLFVPPDSPDILIYYTHSDVRRIFPRFRSYLFSLFPPSEDAHLHLDFRNFQIANPRIFALEPPINHGKQVTIFSTFAITSEHLFALIGNLKDVVKLRIDGPIEGDLSWIKSITFINIHFIHASWLHVEHIRHFETPVILASHTDWSSRDVERLLMMWKEHELSDELFVCAVNTRFGCELSDLQWSRFAPTPSALRRAPFEINSLSVAKLPKLVDMRESRDIRRPGDSKICTVAFWNAGVLILSWQQPEA